MRIEGRHLCASPGLEVKSTIEFVVHSLNAQVQAVADWSNIGALPGEPLGDSASWGLQAASCASGGALCPFPPRFADLRFGLVGAHAIWSLTGRAVSAMQLAS